MEPTSVQFFSKKLCLARFAFYGTVGIVMLLPYFLQPYFSLTTASFLSFLLVVTARALFESHVIYEAPFKKIHLQKVLSFSLLTSVLMTALLSFTKAKLGYFAIPVSVIFAFLIVNKLKAKFFPPSEKAPEPFSLLPEKVQLSTQIMYGFYAIFVPITIILYAYCNVYFFYAFAVGYFFGMLFEEFVTISKLYTQPLTMPTSFAILSCSACCAVMTSCCVWVLMNGAQLEGQPATIISVIAFKLLQPFLAKKFFLPS